MSLRKETPRDRKNFSLLIAIIIVLTSLPASDPGSPAFWGSKRINPQPQSCLCLTWSGYPSNDDEDDIIVFKENTELVPFATCPWGCGAAAPVEVYKHLDLLQLSAIQPVESQGQTRLGLQHNPASEFWVAL